MTEYWDIFDENGGKTGRLHRRGDLMSAGEYHLVVFVWILNTRGEFLISKRAPHIGLGGLWQTTGGSAVAGDDSLTTALKETREEIGIELNPDAGRLYKRLKNRHKEDDGGNFYDVWLFRHDCEIDTVVVDPAETCDARWATVAEIRSLIASGEFIPTELYPYLDELFQACQL